MEIELYKTASLPIFQNRMYDSVAQARNCQTGDIRLVQNLTTGLIYNADFRPELLDYDKAYQNEQGLSRAFQLHLERVADLVEEHMGLKDLIEVGCGKGTFLEILEKRGGEIRGFDPTYEGDSPKIVKEYFGPHTKFTGAGLILRHVLEHIKDPFDFLADLANTNGNQGLIYIEVPCFEWICRNNAWFDIFYEHVNYFRLSDFHRMFGRVLYAGHSFGGQYLSVIGDLSALRAPAAKPSDRVTPETDFLALMDTDFDGDGIESVVWGAASKGVIFSLFRERAGAPVSHLVDINPAKQGKFVPATGLEVKSPQQVLPHLKPGSRIYVMNPNYLEEIRQFVGSDFEYRVMSNG